jgi:IS605 OrfB family transposase
MHRGAPLLRFTITESVPDPDTENATAALGVDWSPAGLGAASMVAEHGGELLTDARTHVYNDHGLGQRLARLQTEGQQLSAKIDRLTRLAAGAPEPTQAQLNAKIAVLQQHRRALGTKRRRINRDIAFDFAKTMTTMATASHAGVIAVEDLRDLQAGGRGKTNNNRAAQSARRQAHRALEHTAARVGLEVVMCPPRGTSARCPSCDGDLARPNGYHSATCAGCGINGADRDQIAGQNIAKRVLLAKTRVKRPKNKPKRIATVAHRPVTKTRQKTTATPKQRRHKRTRNSTPQPAANHAHPARQASVWDRDQPTAPAESTSAQPIPDTRDTTPVSASIRDG